MADETKPLTDEEFLDEIVARPVIDAASAFVDRRWESPTEALAYVMAEREERARGEERDACAVIADDRAQEHWELAAKQHVSVKDERLAMAHESLAKAIRQRGARATSATSPVDGPEIIWTANADAGDSTGRCANCGEEREEPHTWKECAQRLAREVELENARAHDPEHARALLRDVEAGSHEAARAAATPHIQVGVDTVNRLLGLRGAVTTRGDEVKCWTPDGEGHADKTYLDAATCEELARAFEIMAIGLGGASRRSSDATPTEVIDPESKATGEGR